MDGLHQCQFLGYNVLLYLCKMIHYRILGEWYMKALLQSYFLQEHVYLQLLVKQKQKKLVLNYIFNCIDFKLLFFSFLTVNMTFSIVQLLTWSKLCHYAHKFSTLWHPGFKDHFWFVLSITFWENYITFYTLFSSLVKCGY